MRDEKGRHCYVCKKDIPDIDGKYFCSRECWNEYGKDYKPLKRVGQDSKVDIKRLQERALELLDEIRLQNAKKDIVTEAESIFNGKEV